MVLLRGLFGRRGSVIPTTLNIAQNIGWGTIEIIVIATAATALTGEEWRPLWVVLAGIGATTMAVRPLGSVRWLRKVVVWLVLAATRLSVRPAAERAARRPHRRRVDGLRPGHRHRHRGVRVVRLVDQRLQPALAHGEGVVPTEPGWGTALAAILYITLGLVAYSTVVDLDGDVIAGLLAVPAGALALLHPGRRRGRRGLRQRLLDHDVGAQPCAEPRPTLGVGGGRRHRDVAWPWSWTSAGTSPSSS